MVYRAITAIGRLRYPIVRLTKLACNEYQIASSLTPARVTNGRSKTAARTEAGKASPNIKGRIPGQK
jgi:hypothetical protein